MNNCLTCWTVYPSSYFCNEVSCMLDYDFLSVAFPTELHTSPLRVEENRKFTCSAKMLSRRRMKSTFCSLLMPNFCLMSFRSSKRPWCKFRLAHPSLSRKTKCFRCFLIFALQIRKINSRCIFNVLMLASLKNKGYSNVKFRG